MNSADFRPEPSSGYAFPLDVEQVSFTPSDLPGSSIDLSTRAVPNHPEEPDRCLCSLTSLSMTGFTRMERLTALKLA
jgi:hypothetical protein